MNAHPFDAETIMSLLDGELSQSSSEEVRAHISHCSECAALAMKIRAASSALSKWTVAEIPVRADQRISIAIQKLHRRNSMPLSSFFHTVRPRYLIAVLALILVFALWVQLSPSSVILAQDELREKLIKEYSLDPHYPSEAREKKIQGVVRLQVLVAQDGSVKKLSVISGDPLLAKSSLEAVRRWRYKPTLVDGKLVEVKSVVEITFKLYP